MMDERALVESIFKTALQGCDADVGARKHAIKTAAVTLLADVLLETDPLGRERLLHGLVAELRAAAEHLSELLHPPSPCSITDWGKVH